VISEETRRQAAHFGWLFPNGTDLRDPAVYSDAPCGCGCGATVEDLKEMKRLG
jgi:hypothetical protein